MDDSLSLLGLAALLVLAFSFVLGWKSTYELDQAYEQYIYTPVVRNEWGQLRHTPEFMCEATIRQWLDECDG